MNLTVATRKPAHVRLGIGALLVWISALLLTVGAASGQSGQDLHMACLLSEDPDERIDACTVAIEKGGLSKPLLSDALAIRGLMHAQRGDLSEAQADLKRSIAVDTTRKHEETAALLEQINALEAAGENLSGRVLLTACKGWRDPVRQLKACDRLVETMSSSPADRAAALTLRGSVSVIAGKDAAGMRDLDDALRLSPNEPAVRISRANALWQMGRYEEADRELDRLITAGQDARPWARQRAAFAYMQGHLSEAADLLESGTGTESGAGIVRFYAAMLRSEIAKHDSPELFDIPVSATDGPFAAAAVGYRRGKISEGQLLATVAGMQPHSREKAACQAHFSIGQKAAIEGRQEKAVREYQQSVAGCDRGTFEYVLAAFRLKQAGQN